MNVSLSLTQSVKRNSDVHFGQCVVSAYGGSIAVSQEAFGEFFLFTLQKSREILKLTFEQKESVQLKRFRNTH